MIRSQCKLGLVLYFWCTWFVQIDGNPTQFNCTNDDPCDNIHCLDDDLCNINCNGTMSCINSIIDCGYTNQCNILCNYRGSCNYTVIDATNANYLNMTFHTTDIFKVDGVWVTTENKPCGYNSSIICPVKGKKRCSIFCDGVGGGHNACDDLNIYAKEGS